MCIWQISIRFFIIKPFSLFKNIINILLISTVRIINMCRWKSVFNSREPDTTSAYKKDMCMECLFLKTYLIRHTIIHTTFKLFQHFNNFFVSKSFFYRIINSYKPFTALFIVINTTYLIHLHTTQKQESGKRVRSPSRSLVILLALFKECFSFYNKSFP